MKRKGPLRIARSAIRAIPGGALVGVATFVCYGLGLNFSIAGFLYLIIVVLQSLVGDFVSSAIVSFIAVACLDFLFVPPIFSFNVTNPLDALALVSFLITGLVITRLTSRVRREAQTTDLQRQRMKRLYELAQQLLALEPGKTFEATFLKSFRVFFQLRAVCLFEVINAQSYLDGDSRNDLEVRTRAAYISGRDSDDMNSEIFVRCLRARSITMGTIGFEGLPDPELTAGPLAALAAVMLERVRAFRSASHAAAAAEAEVFRGAVLDALAHEFKTPLATILAAAGGIREAGPLRPEQLELAEMVETEASRLGLLTSRLLRTARLDREEIRPQLELIDIAELVKHLVDQYSRRGTDRNLSVINRVEATSVLADAELLRLAVRQLLDNACKYSQPGSSIAVNLEVQNQIVAVRVLSFGSLIRSGERARIFDRFYRGAEGRFLAPGSGLGLYVARKIVHAHGGSLDLETEIPDSQSTAFLLTMPLAKSEV